MNRVIFERGMMGRLKGDIVVAQVLWKGFILRARRKVQSEKGVLSPEFREWTPELLRNFEFGVAWVRDFDNEEGVLKKRSCLEL